MEPTLLFDFTIDRKNRTIQIKREFDASLELIWAAWTQPEILDQWCAPNPYRTETKTMDLRTGGLWHYAIVSPDGNKHWSRYDYKQVVFQKSITELRAFSDENGTVSPDFPRTECTLVFSEREGRTFITIFEKYNSPDLFDKMATTSHKWGFSSHLKNLDKLLSTLKK